MLKGIFKSFGKVQALQGVDLHVNAGTIHGVVGENGAGKTTLMRVLYGAVQPDGGRLFLRGRETQLASSKEAIRAGIGMVSQHYSIVPGLTILENLLLGAEGGAVLKLGEARERAEALAARMGFRFDWSMDAGSLSPAAAQRLEILKLLWRDSKILILDEPTATLPPSDAEAMFETLHGLANQGSTVILVTHKLPEVRRHCSRVTVLRGGRLIAELEVGGVTDREIAALMVGEGVETSPSGAGTRVGTALLQRGDLLVRSGEIVGLAGVDGSGQRELVQEILGVRQGHGLLLFGEDADGWTVADRLERGLAVVPEDRQHEGLIQEWSLEENGALGVQRSEGLCSGGWVLTGARAAATETMASLLSTLHGGVEKPVRLLSGGNQQRFVLGRALWSGPRLLVTFHPSRGLDLKATRELFGILRARCDEGMGALIVSFDLDELLEHCDRVSAMFQGAVINPPEGLERDRATLGRLMVGAA